MMRRIGMTRATIGRVATVRMAMLAAGAFVALAGAAGAAAAAQDSVVKPLNGLKVMTTDKPYQQLVDDLKAAVGANDMGVVTQAGPTGMAAQRGETIPGNTVVGVFRNDFAVTIIRANPAAMIEPPVRFMVMEEPDGTGTLSYIAPSERFAPYTVEGGPAVAEAAAALDDIFAKIAQDATQ